MTESKCPHCNNPICDVEALNCLYCGQSLERDTGFLSRLRYPGPRGIVFLIVMLIVISFIMLMLR
ncbi:MAG: hypothetical protein L6416_06780 [Candidatus Omnitrophica bacterium]|nr:hypothetical protein [Candidatus Omnitrophota bacterium]